MYASKSPVVGRCCAIAACGILSAPVRAAETAADIPKDSYYNDPLTASERSGIAQEENVSPNDGRASVAERRRTTASSPMPCDKADRNARPKRRRRIARMTSTAAPEERRERGRRDPR